MAPRRRDAASRRARRRLTPGDVVAAGVELLDEVGLAGFTTRALADRLGTYPATLYWHVGNRSQVLAAIVDGPVEQLGVVRAFAKAATFKFSVHRINQWWITRNRERPTPEIVAAFDGPWRPGRISKMLGPKTGIRAVVIHHQDMRRAVGIPRVVPEERVRAALDVVLTRFGSTNLGSSQRAAGLRLHADDINWSWGSGPEVTGPAEAILMAVAGRPSALADLSGDGLPVLAGRVTELRGAG